MKKVIGLLLSTFLLCNLSITCFASDHQEYILVYEEQSISQNMVAPSSLKESLGHRRSLFGINNYGDFPENDYGAWPYYYVKGDSMNCYGYASQLNQFLNPGDLTFSEGGIDKFKAAYFQDVNVIAQCVAADISGKDRNIRIISGPSVPLEANEFVMVVRTGFHNDDNNNELIIGDEVDYHFMVRNKDGNWSHKQGKLASVNLGKINPSTYNWSRKDRDYFYDSPPVYFAVEAK